MSSSNRTVVVFGCGPGNGSAIATKFALSGFAHIIILSRNRERLLEEQETISNLATDARVDTVPVDLSDPKSTQQALATIDGLSSDIEVVVYNAARVAPSPLFETPIDVIENDFRTTNIGLYMVAQWALPKLETLASTDPAVRPSLLVTTGPLHISPIPQLFSLSLVKTAQRNLVQSLHQVYQPKGVHVGLTLIGGPVSPDMRTLNPTTIAQKTFDLYSQDKSDWALELEMWEG